MAGTYYIESGTGRQVQSGDTSINPTTKYVESGTGNSLLGSAIPAPAPVVPPTTSGPISADTLKSTDTPLTLPGQMTPDYSTAGIIGQIQTRNTAETEATKGIDETTKRLEEAYKLEGTRADVQNTLEASQGIPDLKKQLKEINDQILGENNAAFGATNKSEDRQAPTYAITGEQAAIERQRAVRTYGLSAASAALQGSIGLANDYVTKALAAQFDPVAAQIKYYTDVAIPLARDKMTEAQKAKADTIAVELAKRAEDVAKEKEAKAAAYGVLTAAGQYAKNFTATPEYPTITTALNAIQSAKDGAEATKIAVATGLVAGAENWGAPYMLGGDYVQKNTKTGEIRTAVNVSAGPAGITPALTAADQQLLLSSGFNATDIGAIQADVQAHGLQAVLDGIADPAQKVALTKAYGGTAPVTPFLNADFLKSTADEKSMLDALGKTIADYDRWYAWDTEASKLNRLKADYAKYVDATLIPLIEQYHKAGYNDQDILKMMQ